jgi:hypothetical protein
VRFRKAELWRTSRFTPSHPFTLVYSVVRCQDKRQEMLEDLGYVHSMQ